MINILYHPLTKLSNILSNQTKISFKDFEKIFSFSYDNVKEKRKIFNIVRQFGIHFVRINGKKF